jgi:ubiquinone/menaquinone biosynthesis C-methylase UbiE
MSAIPDRYIDILFSYNALDHGWDIYKALDEALRISKSGIIAFDCKNGEGPEHDKIDHYQTVNFNNVKEHLLKKFKKAHIDVADLTRIKPNFSYDHNWGFPVALILYEEVTQ